jgi:DUF1009 family protein
LGLKGVTPAELESAVGSPVQLFALGQIQKPIDLYKQAGVTKVVMAGKVQHASLFGGLMPDLRAVKLLARLKDKRTDTILAAIADEFKKDGIELMSSVAYLQDLLVPNGVFSKRKPSPAETADIKLGWRAAKALAGVDVGQSVVVKDGAVVAAEAMEGTDSCIRRAAEIAKQPGLTLVKVAKPNQDMRFDVPVIGLESLKVFAAAGVKAAALEAGSTLIFDKDEFLRRADEQGLALVGYPPEGPQ